MSRIGKRTTKIATGVEVKQLEDQLIVKGPKGEIKLTLTNGFAINIEEGLVSIKPPQPVLVKGKDRALYGLYGSLLKNALIGVTEGYTKQLLLVGVGYKSQVQGSKLVMALGYSHPVEYEIPPSLTVKCIDPTTIEISGIEKQLVGQFCAEIREARPPEPYKGKGILYKGEKVRRKEGKSGGKK